MPYFLSDNNLEVSKEVKMSGEEARHLLLSHRIKIGEQIKLQGPDGKRFLCQVTVADKKSLTVKVVSLLAVPAEPSIEIILFQSIVSEKALDFIFQKGTELGLGKIVLFNSANTSTKLSVDKFQAKKERWQKILIEAAKQSERSKWPELLFASDINQAMEMMATYDKIFLADIEGTKLKTIDVAIKSAAIIIGPEGGFIQEETRQFKTLPNLQTISLGPILLRAETAALSALSIINNLI